MTVPSASGPSRARRWVVPAFLAVLGLSLIAAGEFQTSAATSTYENSLAHDCTAGGCSSIGPLDHQNDYLDGELAIAAGIVLVGVALLAAFWTRSPRRAPPAPGST